MRRVNSQTQHGLPNIHPKMGSTVESRWRVRAAGKPSDEPLRKGETQSPTAFHSRLGPLTFLLALAHRSIVRTKRERTGFSHVIVVEAGSPVLIVGGYGCVESVVLLPDRD